MYISGNEYPFNSEDFSSYIEGIRENIQREISSYPSEKMLNTATNDLAEYLINKYESDKFAIELKSAEDKIAINNLLDNLKVIKEEYKSKYNNYIVYDYEPLCVQGFKYYAEFEVSKVYIDFIMYLITTKLDNINKLEGCLTLQYEGVN